MKKIILFVILLIPILKIDALESYVVMDTKSSRILSSKNMDEKMLIASTTKNNDVFGGFRKRKHY